MHIITAFAATLWMLLWAEYTVHLKLETTGLLRLRFIFGFPAPGPSGGGSADAVTGNY